MTEIHIKGGNHLQGNIKISGSKNAILPMLASSILIKDTVVFENCPRITDVYNMLNILKELGAEYSFNNDTIIINNSKLKYAKISEELATKMRSSVFVLGSLLSRFNRAEIFYPGGCELGKRPIDIHINALKTAGAEIIEKSSGIECYVNKIKSCNIYLPFPSVGATENIIMLGAVGKHKITIYNSAMEDEVVELSTFLNKAGANIKGAGSNVIVINGVEKLNGIKHRVSSDRIVSATYASIALKNDEGLTLEGINVNNTINIFNKILKKPCKMCIDNDKINIHESLQYNNYIETAPSPGFPTDVQPIATTLLSTVNQKSIIVENVFENRFNLVHELNKMGGDITVFSKAILINGVNTLKGCLVKATDLRAGAALILAGLFASGETIIQNAEFVFRGYENIVENLKNVGADIYLSDGG